MTGHWAAIVAIGVIATAGSAIVAAPQTVRPGEMTKAGVWVENRSGSEAIPVNIEAMSQTARPLRIEVVGTPEVALVASTTVLAKVVRQRWEHRLLTIPAGQDATMSLSKVSTENWEAVGFHVMPQGSTLVLLKRPM